MKSKGIYIILTVITVAFYSCDVINFGDKFLSQTPEQIGFNLDSMFSSKLNADRVLTKAYSYNRFPLFIAHSPGRYNGSGRGGLMDLTDMGIAYQLSGATSLYYTGMYSPGGNFQFANYSYLEEGAWEAIRYCYIYIENVDKVSDMTKAEKDARKGEARVMIALRYYEMLRSLGGVPWLDKAFTASDAPELKRESIESLVNHIIELLDEAAKVLPWTNISPSDYLRYTKASAMGLKEEVLLFAASPIFNAAEPYHPDANEYTWYGNYSVDRWKRAEQAGKEFMDALNSNGGYALVQSKGSSHKEFRQAFIDGYGTRGSGEALISVLPVKLNGTDQVISVWNTGAKGGPAFYDLFAWRTWGQTLEYVNMFPMADGSDFPADFNWSNPPFNPFYDIKGNPNRDPRLYETMQIIDDYFQGRKIQNWVAANGFTKGQDLLDNTSTCFRLRKYIQEMNTATSSGKPIQVSFLRLPEVFLSYAEAINEANGGPNATAYDMINRVRNRVGLANLTPGLSQVEFRKALIKERSLELGYEDVPWFDIVRWKMADRLQRKPLTGLMIKKNKTGPYSYQTYDLPERYWQANWDPKWFFNAFPSSEVDKGYGLEQNPGW